MTSVWCVPNVGRDVAARTAKFDEQVRPTLIDGEMSDPQSVAPGSSYCEGDGRHGVRSEFPIPKRFGCGSCAQCDRRFCSCSAGVTVVTNVESDVMARVQRVPVSGPLDSDEENELDALSRNGAGVPVVGHVETHVESCRRIEDPPQCRQDQALS